VKGAVGNNEKREERAVGSSSKKVDPRKTEFLMRIIMGWDD